LGDNVYLLTREGFKMFKKIVLLLLLGTLPMFACGSTISVGGVMGYIITIVASSVSATYGILFLFRKNNKEEKKER